MPIALANARRVGYAAARAASQQRRGAGALSVAEISCRRLSSGPTESEAVGFIGLGKIGFAMATNMMNAGYSLTVFDLDPAAVDRLVAAGATPAGSAAEAAAATSRLVTVLPNDAVLHQVVDEVYSGCMQLHLAGCRADS
jgi:lactate dehydrogenase-like 2-hydroxyacid dehydrogenase